MAKKQIIWKTEKTNKETRQWWIRALLIGVLQLLLLWGTVRLVNNIWGVAIELGMKYKVLAVLLLLGCSVWCEWKSTARKRLIGSIIRRSICIIPIVVICMGLWGMVIPRWSDLVILLLSGVLLIYFDSCEGISWKRLGVLSAFMLLLLWGVGHNLEKAKAQMLSLNGDWFNMWERLGEKLEKGFEDFELPDWSVDKEVIDNKPPEFQDKQIILLTMSEKPAQTIYLRGYHCNDYENGTWVKTTKAFEEACEKYGISEDEAAEKLILSQYKQEDIFDNQPVNYELSYTDIRNTYCYFPYGAGWEETPKYELSQDYLIKKKTGDKVAEITGWQQLYHLDADLDAPREYSIFQSWYNEFVYENYLTVSEEQMAVRRLANEMSRDTAFAAYVTDLNPKTTSYEERNSARLQVAYLVAEWLKRQGRYSLELDKLPTGVDAIEYFLETSHEGFCEHFASAGTLLLRELGVPARYARGYVVKTGAVRASGDDYTASVLDSYAHAWTEIYLDNYGWVPIEMTPGYSGSADITPVPETTPKPGEEFGEDTDLPETPTATPESGEETHEEEEEPTEAPTKEDSDEIGSESHASEEESSKHPGKGMGKVIVVLFIGLGSITFWYLRGNRERGRKRLTGYLRRGENRKAVKWINEEIYRHLVHKDRKYSKIKDKEFGEALKQEFSQVEEARWDAYLAVVRKAVYSADKVTSEEVRECLEVYKVVRRKA